jgi:UPF0755 protein
MDNFFPEQTQRADNEAHNKDLLRRREWTIGAVAVLMVLVIGLVLWTGLSPAGVSGAPVTIVIAHGQGFLAVARMLDAAHLLRSRLTFEIAAFLSGAAFHVQSGTYRLSSDMPASAILRELSAGAPSVTVTIPEGSNLYEIDKTLADAGVIARGDLINFASDGSIEGKLFPDTYQFFEGSDVASVVQKFLDNFSAKAAPLFAADPKNAERDLTLASIIEKEAPSSTDESMIAGIILNRMADGMRLQLDPTVCYAEQIAMPQEIVDCSTLTRTDFTSASPYDSDYNTYLHAGLPPGPIGNPGITAIEAAIHPASSSYLYYISDPATGRVHYAATLAGQNANIKKYLGD